MKKSIILFLVLIFVVGGALVIASLLPPSSPQYETIMSFIITVGLPSLIAAMPWTTTSTDPKQGSEIVRDTKPLLAKLAVKLFSLIKTKR